MSGRLARPLALAAVLLVLFTNLGGPRLFDRDEALNATCGREMFERGDLVVPTFNGELRTAKPALIYWLMSASYGLFGVSEFAARFFSAVASVGTVICVFLVGRQLFGERAGLASAIVLVTSLLFAAVGRACTPDPFLLFGFTLAMLGFVTGVVRRNGRFGPPTNDDTTPRLLVPNVGWLLFTFAAMGLAVLAKGPVGVVLPIGVLGLTLLWIIDARQPESDESGWIARIKWLGRFLDPRRIWTAGWALRPITMVAVVLAIAAPWYVMVGLRTDGAWLQTFLGHDNVGRFTRPMEGHGGPFFYYVPAVLLGFCPWSVFLPAAVIHAWKRVRGRDEDADGFRFLFCWAGLVIVFFSLAATKLPNYVLPAYPALALLVGTRLARWSEELATNDRGFGIGLSIMEWSTLAAVIGVPIATHFLLPEFTWLALAGLIPLPTLALADHAWRTSRPTRSVVALLTGGVTFVVGLYTLVAPAVSVQQDGVLLGEAVRREAGENVRVVALGYFSPNLVFYSGCSVERTDDPNVAAARLAEDPNTIVVVPEERLEATRPYLPADVRELAGHTEFLQDDRVLVVGRRSLRTAAAE